MADYKGYLQDKNNNNLYLEDYDTGWKNLTLLVGSAGFAKYRRVGKMVQILILNFTEWQYNQNFLRIPDEIAAPNYLKSNSYRKVCPSTGTTWARAELTKDGYLQMFNGTCTAGAWVDVDYIYFID